MTDEEKILSGENNDANIFRRFAAWARNLFGAEKPNDDDHHNDPILEQLKYVENEKTKDYIQKRLIVQIDYYRFNSRENKAHYQRLMRSSIIIGALIPVAAVLADGNLPMKFVISILGASVTAINALLSIHNYRDLWLEHRNIRQRLERTLYLYFNDAGPFYQGTRKEKDELLISTCEMDMERETSKWLSMWKKPDEEKQEAKKEEQDK